MHFWLILAIIIALIALWLIMCAPSRQRARCRTWKGTLFAHRGLYGDDCAENSLGAFERAYRAGYGMELDVQFSKDKKLVIFHDDDLMRMTGVEGAVRDKTLEELRALRLQPDAARIPTFEEMLKTVDSRKPLLIEIKNAPDIGALTRATVAALRDYPGEYIVESFNPICLWHLRRIAPEIIRGQLVSGYRDNRQSMRPILAFTLSNLLLNFLASPDFIAYCSNIGDSLAMRIQRRLFRTPLATWTLTDAQTVRARAEEDEMPIFERCRP